MRKLPRLHKHSSGQSRFRINGRLYYCGKHGSKEAKREYDRIVAEWFATDCSPSFGLQKDDFTIAQLKVDYLKFADAYFGSHRNSEALRIRYVMRPLLALYKDLPVKDFRQLQFKTVRDQMIQLGWARSHINASMKRILRMVKWGAVEDLYDESVYRTLQLIPGLKKGRTKAKESPNVEPVDEAVVLKTIEFCSPVVSDMVKVHLLCGCRPGEMVKLTPSLINRTSDVWEAKLEEHKTSYRGKARTIAFGKQAQAILMPYLARGDDEYLFSPSESEEQRRALIPRKTPANQGKANGQ